MMNPTNRTGIRRSSLRILAFYSVTFLVVAISIAGSAAPMQFSLSTASGLTSDISEMIDTIKATWPAAAQPFIESLRIPIIRAWFRVMQSWITAGSNPRGTLPSDEDHAQGWDNQFIDPYTGGPVLARGGTGNLAEVKVRINEVTWFVIQKYTTNSPQFDPRFVSYISDFVQSDPWSEDINMQLLQTNDTSAMGQFDSLGNATTPEPPFAWYPYSQAATPYVPTPYVPEPKPADLQVSWEFEWRGNSAAGVYVNIEAKVKNIGTGESFGTSCWFGMEESMNWYHDQTDFREFDIPPGGWVDYTYSLWVPFGVWTKLVIIIQNDQGDYIREESRNFYAG